MGLCAAKDDTVNYNQRNIDTEGRIQARHIGSAAAAMYGNQEADNDVYAGIRTRSGIILRSADIIILENSKPRLWKVHTRPLTADVVTARVGHIPSIRTKVGFLSQYRYINVQNSYYIPTSII